MEKSIVFQEKIFVEVIIFYKNMCKYMNEMLPRESSLNMHEVFFLVYLEGTKELTYYDLAKTLPFDQSYINKMLKKLEEKGYVNRIKDGRKKKILLTDKCKEELSERPAAKMELIKLLEKNNINLEELGTFVILLKKISKALGESTD